MWWKLLLAVVVTVVTLSKVIGWAQTRAEEKEAKRVVATKEALRNQAEATRRQAKAVCLAQRDQSLVLVKDLEKQGRRWEAAQSVRSCASLTKDAELLGLVAKFDVASHLQTANDTKRSFQERIWALETLEREYPEQATAAKAGQLKARLSAQDDRRIAAERRKQGVLIGMSQDEVLQSAWGRPEKVNRTTRANSVSEQWVYGRNYLYFEDGVLTAIHN